MSKSRSRKSSKASSAEKRTSKKRAKKASKKGRAAEQRPAKKARRSRKTAAAAGEPSASPGDSQPPVTWDAEAFEALLPDLQKIPDEDVDENPTQPVYTLMQEAMNLYRWAHRDRKALLGVGLDWSLVESLPARRGALSHAEALWFLADNYPAEATEAWLAAKEEAEEMRGDLIARMRLAYRESPHLLRKLDKIAEGDKDADLVQDLNDLAVSGRDNWALFRAVGGTTEHLDAAAQASDELAGLLAAHEAVSPDDAKELRDRAFAHLWAAVQTIHKFGKLAFRKDPRRAKGYRNHYLSLIHI